MISLAKSGDSLHVLTPKDTGVARCGFEFPSAPKEILNVDRLEDLRKGEREDLCRGCEAKLNHGGTGTAKADGRTGGSSPPTSAKDASMGAQHLKHKISQMVELKDLLLTHELSYAQFKAKAYPLQKEIRELEAAAK